LSTDAAAAKEVVLAEKPLISEETDLLEPTLLDELICHISSLASVYHKPPNAFVEGKVGARRALPHKAAANGDADDEDESSSSHHTQQQQQQHQQGQQKPTVIPGGDLIGDLLDIGGFSPQPLPSYSSQPMHPSAGLDLLGDGLDSLIGGPIEQSGNSGGGAMSQMNTAFGMNAPGMGAPGGGVGGLSTMMNQTGGGGFNSGISPQNTTFPTNLGGLADIFTGLGITSTVGTNSYVPPKQNWLSAQKGKGMEISGTFARRNGVISMDLDFVNRALQPLSGFAIQLNKNSFGLACATNLQIAVLQPNQNIPAVLTLNTSGPIMKMTPITNLQVAIKNNIDVFYFSVVVPMHVFFSEDGEIDKRLFLVTWKEIPEQNETQYQLNVTPSLVANSDDLCNRLRSNNVFTIAKRNVEGQDMLYQSMKLTNGIWILCELKISPGNPLITVCFCLFAYRNRKNRFKMMIFL
jgi:AP-2 complex subunit beta-1